MRHEIPLPFGSNMSKQGEVLSECQRSRTVAKQGGQRASNRQDGGISNPVYRTSTGPGDGAKCPTTTQMPAVDTRGHYAVIILVWVILVPAP